MLDLAQVVIWSFMVLDNKWPIVSFLFCDLSSPCLVLGKESYYELFNETNVPVPVPKFGGC